MKSTKFTLETRDLLKGLIMAALVPALVIIQQSVAAGSLVFDWKAIATSAIGGFIAYLLKNFFTDSVKAAETTVNKAGGKVIPVILFLLAFSFAANAQKPFFGRTWIKPPTSNQFQGRNAIATNPIVKKDTSFFQLKPMAGVAYSFPNNQAQGVAGLSYQHIKYTFQTEGSPDQAYCDYSFNLLYSLGATSTPKLTNTNASSFGFGIAALNNTLALCLLFNSYSDNPADKQKLKPVAAIMYSF